MSRDTERWRASAAPIWWCAAGSQLESRATPRGGGRGCGAYLVVSVLGERSTVDEIQLSDLLSIMDRTKRSRYPG